MLNTVIFAVEIIWGGSLLIGIALFVEDRWSMRALTKSEDHQQS